MLGIALASLFAVADHVGYDARMHTEARGSSGPAADLQMNPSLSLAAALGEMRFLALYAPRFLLLQPGSRGDPTWLHRGSLGADWHLARGRRLFLGQQLTYGRDSFSYLVAASEGQLVIPDRLPQERPLPYVQSETSLGLDQALSGHLRLATTAAYFVRGGVGEGRATIPLQQGGRLGANLGWTVSPRDVFSTAIQASQAYFDNGLHLTTILATAGWERSLSRTTQGDILAGVTVWRNGGRAEPDRSLRLRPTAIAGIRYRAPLRGQRLEARARVGLTTAVDPDTGLEYGRTESIASLDYSPVQKLTFATGFAGALGLTGRLRGRLLALGTLSASYAFNPQFSLVAGIRAASQPSLQWVGFLGATVSTRGLL